MLYDSSVAFDRQNVLAIKPGGFSAECFTNLCVNVCLLGL